MLKIVWLAAFSGDNRDTGRFPPGEILLIHLRAKHATKIEINPFEPCFPSLKDGLACLKKILRRTTIGFVDGHIIL